MDIREKGKTGEQIALEYLLNEGYEIVYLNYYSAFGEIDIIAQIQNYIVFIEVKTRRKNSMVTPVEAVSLSKQKKILKTAVEYMANNNVYLQPRFDVIEVIMSNKECLDLSINHIKNAFYQGEDSYAPF